MLEIRKDVSWAKCDGEVILVNTENQKCIILDESAEEIWTEIQKTNDIELSICALCDRYQASDTDKIAEDCHQFLEILVENGFIQLLLDIKEMSNDAL